MAKTTEPTLDELKAAEADAAKALMEDADEIRAEMDSLRSQMTGLRERAADIAARADALDPQTADGLRAVQAVREALGPGVGRRGAVSPETARANDDAREKVRALAERARSMG